MPGLREEDDERPFTPSENEFLVVILDSNGEFRVGIQERAYSPQGAIIQLGEKLTSGDQLYSINYINEENVVRRYRTSGTSRTEVHAQAPPPPRDNQWEDQQRPPGWNATAAEGEQAHEAEASFAGMNVGVDAELPVKTFETALAAAVNRFSVENDSDTPDFVLAQYLSAVTVAYGQAVRDRDNFHGMRSKIGGGKDGVLDMSERLERARKRYGRAQGRCNQLQALLFEVLGRFHEHGHPGEPSVRSSWVPDDLYREWQRLASLTVDESARDATVRAFEGDDDDD
jgi:hypothetical protein